MHLKVMYLVKYLEMEIVNEAVLNGRFYMNNRYLSKGCNIVYSRGGPCKQLAMYSSSYDPTQQFDVVDIYKKEVLELTRDGSFCGLWQMAQAANILRRPVLSIYLTELHGGMRLDFNQKFMCIDNRYNERNSVKIMWTPMQVSRNSYPVHFIPLLKAVSEVDTSNVQKNIVQCFSNFHVLFCYFIVELLSCLL